MQSINQQAQVVVGLGKSGLSLVRFLASQGQRFAVADSRENPPELSALQRATIRRLMCIVGLYQSSC